MYQVECALVQDGDIVMNAKVISPFLLDETIAPMGKRSSTLLSETQPNLITMRITQIFLQQKDHEGEGFTVLVEFTI